MVQEKFCLEAETRYQGGRLYYAAINGTRCTFEEVRYLHSVGHGLGRVDCFTTQEVDAAKDRWKYTCLVHLEGPRWSRDEVVGKYAEKVET